MTRLSSVSLMIVSSVILSQPVYEPAPVARVEALHTPQRASRALHRDRLTLEQLPARWRRLAWCESRNQLHAVNNHTYYGLWQIHKGWYKPFGINPRTATLAQQWKIAQHVYERQGATAWSCSQKTRFGK